MNAADLPTTNIGGAARAWRVAVGALLLAAVVFVPVWNDAAAGSGVELRGPAVIAVLPIAWIACLWLAEGMKGVSVLHVERAEITAEPGSLDELKSRVLLVYVAATVVSLSLVALLAFST